MNIKYYVIFFDTKEKKWKEKEKKNEIHIIIWLEIFIIWEKNYHFNSSVSNFIWYFFIESSKKK